MAIKGDLVLPDSLVIGPMKTGTTWLYSYLASRGDVCLPDGVKETFYFDRNSQQTLAWYARHFRRYDPEKHSTVVEVGASYFSDHEAPRRVSDVLGQSNLVVLVRDPVDRAWSHYNHLRRMGYTKLNLDDAVQKFPEIVEASRYSSGLRRWRDFFPEESIRVIHFDQLRQDPLGFCHDACVSLDLTERPPPLDQDELEKYEAAESKSVLLAGLVRQVSYWLRRRQLYGPINAAKRLGVNKLIFGKPRDKPQSIQPGDRALLEGYLADEVEELKRSNRNKRKLGSLG